MSYELKATPSQLAQLNALVDRAFFDAWLKLVVEPVQAIPQPHTRDTAARASLHCQIAVMAVLQERGQLPEDVEVGGDFAMEFVAGVWPLLVLSGPIEKFPQFEPWTKESAMPQNLGAAIGREMLLAKLAEALNPFPNLSAKDRRELVRGCPVVARCTEKLFSAQEMRALESLAAPVVVDYLDRQMELALKRGGVTVEPAKDQAFQGIGEDSCPLLCQAAEPIRDRVLAHRRFAAPPPAKHADDFAQLSGDADSVRRAGLCAALYPSSYEAAHQLLLSDRFLTAVTERDAGARDRTGFKFWPDLRIPNTTHLESQLVGALKSYYLTVFPQFTERELAALVARTPFLVFLECARPRRL